MLQLQLVKKVREGQIGATISVGTLEGVASLQRTSNTLQRVLKRMMNRARM